jgi:hypothetical protein
LVVTIAKLQQNTHVIKRTNQAWNLCHTAEIGDTTSFITYISTVPNYIKNISQILSLHSTRFCTINFQLYINTLTENLWQNQWIHPFLTCFESFFDCQNMFANRGLKSAFKLRNKRGLTCHKRVITTARSTLDCV